MPSAARSGGGSFDSSTFGPPIADPESATRSCLPSRDTRIPRGRFPTAMRSTTDPPTGSITMTLPPVSSDTYRTGPLGRAAFGGGAVGSDDAGGGRQPPAAAVIIAAHMIAAAGTLNRFRIAPLTVSERARLKRNRVACLVQFFEIDSRDLGQRVEVFEFAVGLSVLGDRVGILLGDAEHGHHVLCRGAVHVHASADAKQVFLRGR